MQHNLLDLFTPALNDVNFPEAALKGPALKALAFYNFRLKGAVMLVLHFVEVLANFTCLLARDK